MLQGWHVVGYFDGHYLVEYRYLADGEPPEWGLIYELDLESGWAMHHRMVNGMRGNEILLDMLVWFLFSGFQILIYFYYYVFLFLADHYPLARHGIMTRPQRIVEQCRLMKWSRNRLHPRHRGPGLLGRKPLSA